MLRLLIVALLPLFSLGQVKSLQLLTAEQLSVNSPQQAIDIASSVYQASLKSNDQFNSVAACMFLSSVYIKQVNFSTAVQYDSLAAVHARLLQDNLLMQQTMNNWANDVCIMGGLAQAQAILDNHKHLFLSRQNKETCRWYHLKANCQYGQSSIDSGIQSCQTGIAIAKHINDTVMRFHLQMLLGKMYVNSGKADSINMVYDALAYFEGTQQYRYAAQACSVLGKLYQASFNVDKALQFNLQAIGFYRSANDHNNVADMQLGIGDVYLAQKCYAGANDSYQSSYAFYKKIRLPWGMASATIRLSQFYVETNRLDSAAWFMNEAETINKTLNNPALQFILHGKTAMLQSMLKNYPAADLAGAAAVEMLSRIKADGVVKNAVQKLEDGEFITTKKHSQPQKEKITRQDTAADQAKALNLTGAEYEKLARLNQYSATALENDSSILAYTNRIQIQADAKYEKNKLTASLKDQQIKDTIKTKELKTAGRTISEQQKVILLSVVLLVLVSAGLWLQYKNRKRAEKDKAKIELLQNEIHHRVKNNLAVLNRVIEVAGKDNIENIPAAALKNRIKSIELLHQQLYSGQAKPGNISLQAYFTDLCAAIAATFETTKDVHIMVKAPVEADSHVAEKLGLIVNELVTNSYKYAFAGRNTGTISVIAKQEKQQLYLIVKDDGIGMEAGKNTKSYGMKLIKGLSHELGGKFVFENVDGTAFKLAVPIVVQS